MCNLYLCFFFFQAEDGIRDGRVTGVQTCALPISCQNKNTFKSKASRCRCGLTAMIGLQRSARDQCLRALITRFRDEKFQFASLVAAEGESGLVVAFNQQTWS